jgi:uncharacterized protein (TIGR02145 family)
MKRKFCFFLLASVLLTGLTFCEKDIPFTGNWNNMGDESNQKKDSVPLNPNLNLMYDSVKDIDGNVYKTIKIGSQVWMAENLRTARYNDGGNIHKGYGAPAGYTDWFDLRIGAYVWWDNGGPSDWGALYNWFAVGKNNLCPSGWHVPSRTEWKTLIQFLGGAASGKLRLSGTNESGFNAIITGDLCGWGFCPGSCMFWTATDYGSTFPYAYCVALSLTGDPVLTDCAEPQSTGFNVRCMKDN